MNGLTLLVLIALAIGVVLAWRAGIARGRREAPVGAALQPLAGPVASQPLARTPAPEARPPSTATPVPPPAPAPAATGTPLATGDADRATLAAERYRLVLAWEARAADLERARTADAARLCQLADFAEERRALHRELADARADAARYRTLLVDLENAAPSGFLGAPGSTDDLKLIVGVGPVLERMLHQLGVTTYRQIARWTDRDIDEFDRRLPEFPGRIRRDAWVTQAHALHQSKYGEALPPARAR